MLTDDIIRRLKSLRKERRLSIAEVSKRMGFKSPMGYANLELGKVKITIEHLDALTNAYQLGIGELLGLHVEMKKIDELQNIIDNLRDIVDENKRLVELYEKKDRQLGRYVIESALNEFNIDQLRYLGILGNATFVYHFYCYEISERFKPSMFEDIIEDLREEFFSIKEQLEKSTYYTILDAEGKNLVDNYFYERYSPFEMKIPIQRSKVRFTRFIEILDNWNLYINNSGIEEENDEEVLFTDINVKGKIDYTVESRYGIDSEEEIEFSGNIKLLYKKIKIATLSLKAERIRKQQDMELGKNN